MRSGSPMSYSDYLVLYQRLALATIVDGYMNAGCFVPIPKNSSHLSGRTRVGHPWSTPSGLFASCRWKRMPLLSSC